MAFYDEDIMPGRGIQRAGIIATDDEKEIERAARLAEERRIRANVLEEALARAPETDAAATIVNRRGADGVSRLYTVDGGGQIVSPTNRERPFSEDEWAALDRAVAARDRAALGDLYSPERRTQGLGYAASGLLDEAELRRRREEAFGPKGDQTTASERRSALIRRDLAKMRAYGNGPSAKQQETQKRWDAERAARSKYPNERNARMAMAEASRASAERLAQMGADARLALALQQGLDAKAIAEINQKGTLSLEQLRSMNQRQLQELINKGNLSVAQEQGSAQRAVAETEGRSRVEAAEATASGVRDAGLAKAQADAEAQRQEARNRIGQDLLTYIRLGGAVDQNTLSLLSFGAKDAADLQKRIDAAKAAAGGSPELAKMFYDQVVAPQLGTLRGASATPQNGAGTEKPNAVPAMGYVVNYPNGWSFGQRFSALDRRLEKGKNPQAPTSKSYF